MEVYGFRHLKSENETNMNRQANIDLYRIFNILIIIAFHYVYCGQLVFGGIEANKLAYDFLWHLGELGVNGFILISGYMSIGTFEKNNIFKHFRLSKIFSMIVQMGLFGILINLYLYSIGIFELNTLTAKLTAIFPFYAGQFWFAIVYILFYSISPWVNKSILETNRFQHKLLIIILLVYFSLVPSLFGIFYNTSEYFNFYNRYIWFIIMYLIGSYIYIYQNSYIAKHSVRNMLICILIIIATVFVGEYFADNIRNVGFSIGPFYLWTPNNPVMVILSISVFNMFRKLKVQSNRIISYLARGTFCVYLIHDGQGYFVWWNNIIHNQAHKDSPFFLTWILLAVIVIFVAGEIAFGIWNIFDKKMLKIICVRIDKWFERYIEKNNIVEGHEK